MDRPDPGLVVAEVRAVGVLEETHGEHGVVARHLAECDGGVVLRRQFDLGGTEHRLLRPGDVHRDLSIAGRDLEVVGHRLELEPGDGHRPVHEDVDRGRVRRRVCDPEARGLLVVVGQGRSDGDDRRGHECADSTEYLPSLRGHVR